MARPVEYLRQPSNQTFGGRESGSCYTRRLYQGVPWRFGQFVDDYKTAFATLALTDTAWASDTNKKKRLMQNLYCKDTQYLHAMLNNPGYDYVAMCQYLHDEAGRSDRLNNNESIKRANNVIASHGLTGGEALLTVLNTMKQYPRAKGSKSRLQEMHPPWLYCLH